jgi:hypothetical protein
MDSVLAARRVIKSVKAGYVEQPDVKAEVPPPQLNVYDVIKKGFAFTFAIYAVFMFTNWMMRLVPPAATVEGCSTTGFYDHVASACHFTKAMDERSRHWAHRANICGVPLKVSFCVAPTPGVYAPAHMHQLSDDLITERIAGTPEAECEHNYFAYTHYGVQPADVIERIECVAKAVKLCRALTHS